MLNTAQSAPASSLVTLDQILTGWNQKGNSESVLWVIRPCIDGCGQEVRTQAHVPAICEQCLERRR